MTHLNLMNTLFPPSINDLGYAAVNMSYADFCAAIGEPAGDYTSEKYAHFKALGKAFNALGWSEATINRVVSAYTHRPR